MGSCREKNDNNKAHYVSVCRGFHQAIGRILEEFNFLNRFACAPVGSVINRAVAVKFPLLRLHVFSIPRLTTRIFLALLPFHLFELISVTHRDFTVGRRRAPLLAPKRKESMKALKFMLLALSFTVGSAAAGQAQQPSNPTQAQVQRSGDNPLYKITINVVERTTKAINYRHHSGSTKIDFRGTPLLPEARGEAKVESKQGYIEIEVEFDDLQGATRFGPEYLTYVMWAITPEGRATNLGEVILNGTKSKLNVTTELQAFGLIVTAEPYFAVSQPSDVVVMENFVRKDTVGKIEEIDAKYELLQRGQYAVNVPPSELKPIPLDKDTPLDLHEARNAVRIARWTGADRDASESFQKADKLLQQAESYKARKAGNKPVAMTAREAVQTAEDARLIALKRQDEQRVAQERQAAAEREAQAKAQAERSRVQAQEDASRRTQAEADQRLEAERRARAEAERAAAQAQATAAQAQAEAARERGLKDQAAADQARQAAARAEQEKAELRARLVQQLNLILETRDTARGLVVNISDVLFDTGQYTLRPAAREKLARVSGIVLAHPGLRLEVEGHTDSVGSDEFNQQLSEKRAAAVRDFLLQQGISINSVSARGFGKTVPVASNDTAAGRQLNRRVEMIVAGDVIGIPIGPSSSLQRQ
jgi:outer membrane protein OmpA-like peptidoglycan-associated protein